MFRSAGVGRTRRLGTVVCHLARVHCWGGTSWADAGQGSRRETRDDLQLDFVDVDRRAGRPQCRGVLRGDGGQPDGDDYGDGSGACQRASAAGGSAGVVALWRAAQRSRARRGRNRIWGLLLIAVPAGSGRGAWLALLAAGGVTAGALLARRLAGVDILALGAWQFLIGAAMLAGVATAIDGPPRANWSINFVVAVLVLAVGGTALPYVAWFAELRRAPITAVTSWTLLVPVVGVGMSVLILREPVTPEQFIGDATVVAALAIVARSGRQKQNDVTPPSAQ